MPTISAYYGGKNGNAIQDVCAETAKEGSSDDPSGEHGHAAAGKARQDGGCEYDESGWGRKARKPSAQPFGRCAADKCQTDRQGSCWSSAGMTEYKVQKE